MLLLTQTIVEKYLEYLTLLGFETQRGFMGFDQGMREINQWIAKKKNWDLSTIVHESSLEQISLSEKNILSQGDLKRNWINK